MLEKKKIFWRLGIGKQILYQISIYTDSYQKLTLLVTWCANTFTNLRAGMYVLFITIGISWGWLDYFENALLTVHKRCLFVLSVMWTPFNISLNPQHLSLIQYWILCVLCVTYTSSTLLFHGTLNEYSTLVKYWHYLFRKVYIFHFRHAFRSHQVKKINMHYTCIL